ncbi:MAG: hypothetical protein V1836_01560 [Candidatus Aenigmatarchaeota archaeon]
MDRRNVTIESMGNVPVFAVFGTKEEAFMAIINLNKDKTVLQEN